MQSLKHPGSDLDFSVDVGYFLGDLNVYDREESLGALLETYDPNRSSDLTALVRDRILASKRFERLSADHKRILLQKLRGALALDDDFAKFFDPESAGDFFALPYSWEIREPRKFFEEIYRQIVESWDIAPSNDEESNWIRPG